MNLYLSLFAFICGSWQSIYLYGLYVEYSVKYNHLLIIFPVISFSWMLFCLYLEMRKAEERTGHQQ